MEERLRVGGRTNGRDGGRVKKGRDGGICKMANRLGSAYDRRLERTADGKKCNPGPHTVFPVA